MKRSWNWFVWIGFVFVLIGFLTYPFFVQFPVIRDVPWANFLLLSIGGILLVIGLGRAFRRPDIYRGRIFAPILSLLGLLVIGFFSYIYFYELRQLPASTGAPRIGQKAPEFTLPDQDDKPVALTSLISTSGPNGKASSALLIFYRGFW